MAGGRADASWRSDQWMGTGHRASRIGRARGGPLSGVRESARARREPKSAARSQDRPEGAAGPHCGAGKFVVVADYRSPACHCQALHAKRVGESCSGTTAAGAVSRPAHQRTRAAPESAAGRPSPYRRLKWCHAPSPTLLRPVARDVSDETSANSAFRPTMETVRMDPQARDGSGAARLASKQMVPAREVELARRGGSNRDAALVIRERGRRNRRAEAGPARAQAEIDVLERVEIPLVEQPDAIEHLAADQHHTAADRVDDPAGRRRRCPSRAVRPRPDSASGRSNVEKRMPIDETSSGRARESSTGPTMPIRGSVRRTSSICASASGATIASLFTSSTSSAPRVERVADPDVAAARKAQVLAALEHARRRERRSETRGRAIARSVVHDDDLIDRPAGGLQRQHRELRLVRRLEVQDDRGRLRRLVRGATARGRRSQAEPSASCR